MQVILSVKVTLLLFFTLPVNDLLIFVLPVNPVNFRMLFGHIGDGSLVTVDSTIDAESIYKTTI